MQNSLRGLLIGALALTGVTIATAEADAMPVQPLSPIASSAAGVEQVYYYGYRRPFFRYRYGVRRPFYGYRGFVYRPYYGFRRPFYGYGYGFRRF